jgi:hypothetical protein
MGKLELNVETYRVIAETLLQLRATTRALLQSCYGDAWQERGMPEPLRGFLDQRRAREAAIQWRLLERVDLLDFAGFENIAEVVSACPSLIAAFAPVSPDADLLRARFVELDSIQARVAFARPVTESEMEFVVSFSERLRRVPIEVARNADDEPVGPDVRPSVAGRERAAEPVRQPIAAPSPSPPASSPRVRASAPSPTAAVAPERSGTVKPTASTVAKTISATELAHALDAGNTALVLTALYAEVTRLAELLWEEGIAGHASQWEIVRETRWYNESFSHLQLKALSDFYDLHRDVGERAANGGSRTEIQEMLQQRRFGEILLALRELFRRFLVADAKADPGAAKA